MVGVPRLVFIRRAAAAALWREITRGPLKRIVRGTTRMFSRFCARAGVYVYVCVWRKSVVRKGDAAEEEEWDPDSVCTCVCACLKRNIFLYYYSHRAYFSYPPTCIPGGWVCSFSLRLSSPDFFSSLLLPGRTRKIQPRMRGVPFFFRYEKLRGAQERGKRSASIKRSSLFLPLCLLSLYDRAAIAAPTLTQLALHNDNNGEIKAIKITRAKREPRANPRWH